MAIRVAQIIEPDGEPAEVIYGTLIAAGVLATKAHKGESGAAVLWSALLVLGLYWVAHVYADVIGERLTTLTRPGWSAILQAALRDWSMLRGSLMPVLVFAVVRGCGASVNASGLAALWLSVGLLGSWGMVAAVRGGARGLELAVETLVCASLGLLVVVLKILVH